MTTTIHMGMHTTTTVHYGVRQPNGQLLQACGAARGQHCYGYETQQDVTCKRCLAMDVAKPAPAPKVAKPAAPKAVKADVVELAAVRNNYQIVRHVEDNETFWTAHRGADMLQFFTTRKHALAWLDRYATS